MQRIENISKSQAIEEYFFRVYQGDGHTVIDDRGIFYRINFKKKSEKFNLIDQEQYAVLIPEKTPKKLLEELKNGYPNKRKLQEYCASVSRTELKQLCGSGSVAEVNGVFVLQDPRLYDKDKGLAVASVGGQEIFM